MTEPVKIQYSLKPQSDTELGPLTATPTAVRTYTRRAARALTAVDGVHAPGWDGSAGGSVRACVVHVDHM